METRYLLILFFLFSIGCSQELVTTCLYDDNCVTFSTCCDINCYPKQPQKKYLLEEPKCTCGVYHEIVNIVARNRECKCEDGNCINVDDRKQDCLEYCSYLQEKYSDCIEEKNDCNYYIEIWTDYTIPSNKYLVRMGFNFSEY